MTALFFASDSPKVMGALSAFLSRDPAGIVASYVIGKEDPFGAEAWERHFGIKNGSWATSG